MHHVSKPQAPIYSEGIAVPEHPNLLYQNVKNTIKL